MVCHSLEKNWSLPGPFTWAGGAVQTLRDKEPTLNWERLGCRQVFSGRGALRGNGSVYRETIVSRLAGQGIRLRVGCRWNMEDMKVT